VNAAETADLADFQARSLVFDIHVHPRSALPAFFRHIGCRLLRRMPPLRGLDAFRGAGVDGCALAGVGDRQIGGPLTVRAISRHILKQLNRIRAEIAQCGGVVVLRPEDIIEAKAKGALGFLLALEGGDMVRSLDDLDNLARLGVRMLTLVHLNDNVVASVGATTWSYWLGGKRVKKNLGLTAFGETVVRRMNELGMIVDVAHAHPEAVLEIARVSSRPLIASHSGARVVSEFHRYLTDEEISAIAGTGGVIGLWPMFYWGRGMAGPEDFKAHLRHIMNLAGEDHLAIGTDVHGIAGLMPGFTGIEGFPILTGLLFEAGLNETQARKVLGENFLRVLRENPPTC
jgi:microsomal dipeptidase-like Zn-dependent dipeptidase